MEEKMLAAKDYALIDLHLHLDGSLSLASVRQLAAMEQLALPESDKALLSRLQVSRDCKDLNEYLEKLYLFSSRSKSQCVCVKCRKISSNIAMADFICG